MDHAELSKLEDLPLCVGYSSSSWLGDGGSIVVGLDNSSNVSSMSAQSSWVVSGSGSYSISSSYIHSDSHATLDFTTKPEQKLTVTGLGNGVLISGATDKNVVLDRHTIRRLASLLAVAVASGGEDLPDMLLSSGGDNLVKMVISEYLHAVDKTMPDTKAG